MHDVLKIDFEKLKYFQSYKGSKKSGSLISSLRAGCDNFEENYDKKELYDFTKDCFLKFQKDN